MRRNIYKYIYRAKLGRNATMLMREVLNVKLRQFFPWKWNEKENVILHQYFIRQNDHNNDHWKFTNDHGSAVVVLPKRYLSVSSTKPNNNQQILHMCGSNDTLVKRTKKKKWNSIQAQLQFIMRKNEQTNKDSSNKEYQNETCAWEFDVKSMHILRFNSFSCCFFSLVSSSKCYTEDWR